MIRALIFDFDGLVIDSEVAVAGSWQEAFATEGLAFPEDLWRTMIGTREHDDVLWLELERLTGRRVDAAPLEAERRLRAAEIANTLTPLPGVIAALEHARESGRPCAIASSSSLRWVGGHLTRLGLDRYFEVVCTKEDAPKTKPDPGIYLEVLVRLGIAAGEAVALEDSAPGVAAARTAGTRVIAVPGSYTEHMDFSAADIVVGSLAEEEPGQLLARLERVDG